LIDFAGAILELYTFDAYGNAIGFDPSVALTEFLYSGEQFDSKIGQQYLRARYYDPTTGRFNRLDPFFGNLNDPQSLHNYLYCYADPVNGIDPIGEGPFFFVLTLVLGMGIGAGVGYYNTGTLEGAIIGGIIGGGIGATVGLGAMIFSPTIVEFLEPVSVAIVRALLPTGFLGGAILTQACIRAFVGIIQTQFVGYEAERILYPLVDELERLDRRITHTQFLNNEKQNMFRQWILNAREHIHSIIELTIGMRVMAPLNAQAGPGWNMSSLAKATAGIYKSIQIQYLLLLNLVLDIIEEHPQMQNRPALRRLLPKDFDPKTTFIQMNYIQAAYGLLMGDINIADDMRLFSTAITELDMGNIDGAERDFINWLRRVNNYGTLYINGKQIPLPQ
jgi:RHS repeat-associated protein